MEGRKPGSSAILVARWWVTPMTAAISVARTVRIRADGIWAGSANDGADRGREREDDGGCHQDEDDLPPVRLSSGRSPGGCWVLDPGEPHEARIRPSGWQAHPSVWLGAVPRDGPERLPSRASRPAPRVASGPAHSRSLILVTDRDRARHMDASPPMGQAG